MANLQKHRAHESLNVDTSAGWDVQTRLTISSQAHVYSDVSSSNQIGIHSDSAVKFRFDTSTSDTISANNDLVIPSDTLTFIKVPKGVGNTMYVHFKQVASVGTKYLRIVHL
jgi:hypothetical protein